MRIPATVLLALLCLMLQAQDYVRVTRAEDITEDAEYIIGAMGYTNPQFYVMTRKISTGRFVAQAYAEATPATLSADCEAARWTVCYSSDAIALYDEEDHGIGIKSGTQLQIDAPLTFWTPQEQADGTFKFLYNGKLLHINSNMSASCFGYYADSGSETHIVLYKRATPHSQWTTYRRHLTSGRWETLCLPFATTVPAGVEAIIAEQRQDSEISYSPATYIPAGTPCLIRSKGSTVVTLQSDGTTVTSPNAHTPLRGAFTPLHPTGYALDGTALAPLASGALIPAFRAYLPQ